MSDKCDCNCDECVCVKKPKLMSITVTQDWSEDPPEEKECCDDCSCCD